MTLLDSVLKSALESVSVSTLSWQLREHGVAHSVMTGLTAFGLDCTRVGVAHTIRYVAFREDLFATHGMGFNLQKRVFDRLEPGEILVIEARGENGAGGFGDVLAQRALSRGAIALVTDGAVRDALSLAELGIPIAHRGTSPAVLGQKHVPWEENATITCAGVAVQPGDIVALDGSGVVVIPPQLVSSIATAAVAQELEEAFVADRVREGEPLAGLYPMDAEWRARYVVTAHGEG